MKKAPAPFTKYRFCCAQRGEPPGDGRIAGGCGIPSGVVERADRKKEGDGKMKRRDADLLDRMAQEIGCLYLSDLRWPDGAGRKKLADLVQRLTPDEASLREWNDALAYLTDAPQQPTAEQARAALLHYLQPETAGSAEERRGPASASRSKRERRRG